MRTYQDIEVDIRTLVMKSGEMAMMTREDLFNYVASLVAISDELNNFSRDMELQIANAEQAVHMQVAGTKCNASMLSLMIKNKTAPFKADKEWADKQVLLLRDLRIAALSAKRDGE